MLMGPGKGPVGEQAQGEKFEAEQNRQGGYFFIYARHKNELRFKLALIGGISSDPRLSAKFFIKT